MTVSYKVKKVKNPRGLIGCCATEGTHARCKKAQGYATEGTHARCKKPK